MLSGVPGLLTFTMVSDDVLESTSELPSSVHDMLGCGFPVTLQVSVMLSPSSTICLGLLIVIDGESIIENKLKSANFQKYDMDLNKKR